MMLMKTDEIRLHDGRIGEIVDVWGVVRCHALVKCEDGTETLIIAERDVEYVLRRPAIRKISQFK
jgi:rRNA processing protein Gar1